MKEKFLANRESKQRFINILSKELEKAGCCCVHANEDADLMILKTALNSSYKIDTILIGEDLLVLLCYHFRQEPFGVFLVSEPKQSTAHQMKTSNIRALTETLGPAVCSHMLLLYALLGCDTTRRIYGIGKATTLKKAMINEHFRKQAQVF